jgi:hypothetical protein
MNFTKLHQDTTCNCIENTENDTTTIFARKINKPEPRERDFLSKWEKVTLNGQLPTLSNCIEICGFKGISMNIWTTETQLKIIEKYVTTFQITPKHKDSIFVFKFKNEAGLVAFTPNKNDPFHFDFYKADDFDLQFLDSIDIIYLKDYIIQSI